MEERRLAQKPEPPVFSSATLRSLPFELLPPGSWDISLVIEHYRVASRNPGPALEGRVIDWQRLKEMNRLHPNSCYIGKDGWEGYLVFGFAGSTRVVLECPIQGNATYILSGNWQKVVGHSKRYLRQSCPEFCERIFHRGDWLGRIRLALQH